MYTSPAQQEKINGTHPFKKYFEELEIGDQLVTEKRMITSEDIDRFADLSGDHFYAHLTSTDFEGTMFERQVAHGYFIMSAAAGLFVNSYEKNPVLLNYGIDELRFTKPVYPGSRNLYPLFLQRKNRPGAKRRLIFQKGS
jgi:oxepin-CoA hydrolase/3-oxo-5,6-dehydrosuberyl-CoA semialdehyde dehydrogenase